MTVQHTVSRFQFLERPVAAPSKCVVCGGYDRPVVDFGVSIQWYGAIVICTDCVGEAGRVVGLVSVGDVSDEKQYAERFISNYLNDNNLVAIPRDFFDTAVDSIRGLSDAIAGAVLHIPMETASDVPNDTTGAAADSSSSDSEQGSGTKRSSGQGSRSSRGRRSNDVSSDSGDALFRESIGD